MFERKRLSLLRTACLFSGALSMIASDSPAFAQRGESLTVSGLRCEYLTNPLAIDTREPRNEARDEAGSI
jgi:hypothetical protein